MERIKDAAKVAGNAVVGIYALGVLIYMNLLFWGFVSAMPIIPSMPIMDSFMSMTIVRGFIWPIAIFPDIICP